MQISEAELQQLALSRETLTWRQVVEQARSRLSPEERERLDASLDNATWFLEHRSTLDTWRERLRIKPVKKGAGHPRFHPITIYMVYVLIVEREIRKRKLGDIQSDLLYAQCRRILDSISEIKPEDTRLEWFREVQEIDNEYDITHRMASSVEFDSAEAIWRSISQKLVGTWRPDSPNDFSDDAFRAIAWAGIRRAAAEVAATTKDVRFSAWSVNHERSEIVGDFRLTAGAYYTIGTRYLDRLSANTVALFQIMFPLAVKTLREGVLDFVGSDLLILNWLAGKDQPITGSFYLRHSEDDEKPQCYRRAENFLTPGASLIDRTMDRLYADRGRGADDRDTGDEIGYLRCELYSHDDLAGIRIKAAYHAEGNDLEVESSRPDTVELWQISGKQRISWEPKNVAKTDITADLFVDDLTDRSPDQQGLRLRFAYNGLQFVTIPAGRYTIGDRLRLGASDERPVHQAKVEAFSLSIMPVTIGFYRRFLRDCPEWRNNGEKVLQAAIENTNRPKDMHSHEYLQVTRELEDLIERMSGADNAEKAHRMDKAQRVKIWSMAGFDDLPVYDIPWRAAVAFCNWLSIIFALDPAYKTGEDGKCTRDVGSRGFRLPTEIEWEVAASCGGRFMYGFSDHFDKNRHTWRDNPGESVYERIIEGMKALPVMPQLSVQTDSVKKTSVEERGLPNAWWKHGASDFGVYQMLGNVWEFTEDLYDEYAYEDRYGRSVENKPHMEDVGNDQTVIPARVVRGGSFDTAKQVRLRASTRHWVPETHCHYVGFRVARNLPF